MYHLSEGSTGTYTVRIKDSKLRFANFDGSLWELHRDASLDAKKYFDLRSSLIPPFVMMNPSSALIPIVQTACLGIQGGTRQYARTEGREANKGARQKPTKSCNSRLDCCSIFLYPPGRSSLMGHRIS